MIWMTGGWNAYREAFRELWLFNSGTVSVFEKGWPSFRKFSSAVFVFTIYGIGAGAFTLGTAVYSLIRHRRLTSLDLVKVKFFSFWLVPPVLFYLLIFIHPANPGYALVFLPAVLVIAAVSIRYMGARLKQIIKKDLFAFISAVVIAINISFFLFSTLPVSSAEVRNHDRNLSIMLDGIRAFEPSTTAVFAGPYIFYGFRQVMYYLPEYRAYQYDVRVARSGEIRNTFWGVNRSTFATDEIVLPAEVSNFIILLISIDKYRFERLPGVDLNTLFPSDISIASGDISLIKKIFPEQRIR